MLNEYITKLGLNPNHTFKRTNMESVQKRGQDTDFTTYEEFDVNGNFIREITICDSMSIYPPFERNISFK